MSAHGVQRNTGTPCHHKPATAPPTAGNTRQRVAPACSSIGNGVASHDFQCPYQTRVVQIAQAIGAADLH